MTSVDLKDLKIPQVHKYLLSSIGPRPICFASTIDADGNRNLSPFSFFNVFSSNPPTVVFSPARSGRTGKTKNTHDNVKEVAEVVINVVTYDMVHQMNLSSSPYEKGVDEFVKSGFTPLESELVKPFRVAESPIQMECKVKEVVELGESGGSGNLVICEVLRMHFNDAILNEDKTLVDQEKIDLVARMGGNWYCRAHGNALFEVQKPITTIGVGIDVLPENIRTSKELSGNDLGLLGGMEYVPGSEEIENELSRMDSDEITLSKAKDALQNNELYLAYAILSKIL